MILIKSPAHAPVFTTEQSTTRAPIAGHTDTLAAYPTFIV